MRHFNGIIESAFPPNTSYMWVANGDLKYFTNGKWQIVGDNQGLVEELGVEVDYLGKAMGLIEKNVATLQRDKLSSVPAATPTTIGGITKGVAVADLAEGADLPTIIARFNALLVSLRGAGIITT